MNRSRATLTPDNEDGELEKFTKRRVEEQHNPFRLRKREEKKEGNRRDGGGGEGGSRK